MVDALGGLALHGTIQVAFPIYLVEGVFDESSPLRELSSGNVSSSARRLVFVDHNVWHYEQNNISRYFDENRTSSRIIIVSVEEDAKNESTLRQVLSEITRFDPLRRSEPVIVIGGGVLMDVVGFACSMYRRGIPYIRVPTTLIGQIDAGVGVKTGINVGGMKNRLGAYYAPLACLNDRTLLATLPKRQIASGIAEAIKIAVVKDATLFELIERHGVAALQTRMANDASVSITDRAIRGIVEELEPNLTEQTLDRLADFGHTFSPRLELAMGMLHGEAVAIDIAISCALAHIKGFINLPIFLRVLRVLRSVELPTDGHAIDANMLEEGLAESIRHRNGRQRVALPVSIGEAVFANDITLTDLQNALSLLRQTHATQH
ncbi:sedoheptulose 7-phosphate cyclase [Microbacterium sp. P04]|uniref:sedoheptulose 7-phosphate cyclase n=1 Tax=Microbacterium sp. P04 TaxID=3366947 RepID=UPI003746ABBA